MSVGDRAADHPHALFEDGGERKCRVEAEGLAGEDDRPAGTQHGADWDVDADQHGHREHHPHGRLEDEDCRERYVRESPDHADDHADSSLIRIPITSHANYWRSPA